jgi:hypothetical protein
MQVMDSHCFVREIVSVAAIPATNGMCGICRSNALQMAVNAVTYECTGIKPGTSNIR